MTRRRPCSCQGSGTEPSGTVHAGLAEQLPCGDCGPDCPDDCGCRADGGFDLTEPALDLDAIEARVLDAVSGPWDAHLTEWEAREDVPALVAEVRRLRAEVEQARAEMAAADRHRKDDPCEICTHMSIEDALAAAEAAVAERDRARDTAAAAEAELARVAELHSEGSGGADAPVPWCLECSTPWPCPTTRAITQGWPESEALGGLGASNTADGHSGTGEAENGPQSGMQPVFVAEVRKVTPEDGRGMDR